MSFASSALQAGATISPFTHDGLAGGHDDLADMRLQFFLRR